MHAKKMQVHVCIAASVHAIHTCTCIFFESMQLVRKHINTIVWVYKSILHVNILKLERCKDGSYAINALRCM